MIYLDNSATSFPKPDVVKQAMGLALDRCANPSRGGHAAAMAADRAVFRCRETAAELFDCQPEQVVFTSGCTHGLNMAIRTLVKPCDRVLISGFEHNAVTRPLHRLDAQISVAGRRLFCPEDTLEGFDRALRSGVSVAVFTHVSNVFGYVLPVEEMSRLCRHYGVPFIIDAAQSAGVLPVQLRALGADFIAIPGHKGLLGPQGVGMLLCGSVPEPLICGGTGSSSALQEMPGELPERAEAGTLNVPGIVGLHAGMRRVRALGPDRIARKEKELMGLCAEGLRELGYHVFSGEEQTGVVSFVGVEDCEVIAGALAAKGIAVRAGLHCAPLAHESAGTLATGTVRVSFGPGNSRAQVQELLRNLSPGM